MESQGLDFGDELKKLQEEVLKERETTIDQLLQAIVDEYYWRTRGNIDIISREGKCSFNGAYVAIFF